MAPHLTRDARFGYIAAAAGIGLLSALLSPFPDDVGLVNVGLLFLLLTLVVSATWGRWPGIFSAVLADLALNFFFIEPLNRLNVADEKNAVALVIFLIVSVVGSSLLGAAREAAARARRREEQTEVLLKLNRAMIGQTQPEAALAAVCQQVAEAFGASASAVLAKAGGAWTVLAVAGAESASRLPPPDEREMAERAIQQGSIESAGGSGLRRSRMARIVTRWPASTSRQKSVVVVPLQVGQQSLGVLRLDGPRRDANDDAPESLLKAFAGEAALALQRVELAREAARSQALQEASDAKTTLMLSISHDLKTPLASIKTSVSSLLDRGVSWSKDDVEAFLETIDSQADYLNRAISDILDLNRVESGAVRPLLRPTAAIDLLQDAAERAAPGLGDHHLLVEAGETPAISVDASLVVQALVNLIENAARYSRPGGDIRVSASGDGAEVELAVEDEGPGIAAEDLPHIFERFYRARRQVSGVRGSGLGLAIVKAFVELSGGTVSVESSPKGSRFTLRLPAANDVRKSA